MKTYLKYKIPDKPGSSVLLFIVLIIIFSTCQNKQKSVDTTHVVEITSMELQPDIYLHESITAYANQDFKKSADDIRKAVDAIQLIASVSKDENQKKALENSIAELLELQSNVAFNKVDGVSELNYFFSRAGQALAGYHINVYTTEYYNLQGKKAGKELRNAIATIENSVSFLDREFNDDEKALLSELKIKADLLEKGKDVPKEEIEKLITELNEKLTKWGGEIEVNYYNLKDKKKVIIHDKI